MHETDEALSAYLDDEVDEAQRAKIEAHLQMCTECSATAAALRAAAGATAALVEVTPTADESRAIRLAVIERGVKRRRFAPRAWALLGGAAIVAVGVAGYGLLSRSGGPENATQASTAEGPALAFLSEREVKTAVESLKEVKQGASRYTVDDVGTKQSKALASFDTSANDAGARSATSGTTYGATSSEARTGEEQSAPAPAQAPAGVAIGDCLRIILRSQPYPMMPVLARTATFKGAPAWMLVYAWTASTDPKAPLDRIQVWLVDRTRCSPDTALYYASFKP